MLPTRILFPNTRKWPQRNAYTGNTGTKITKCMQHNSSWKTSSRSASHVYKHILWNLKRHDRVHKSSPLILPSSCPHAVLESSKSA